MILKDVSFNTPEENILYDELILLMAEESNGPEILRFWESKENFIVLGKISKVKEDLKIDQIKKDNIPVLRRSSGGGTVIQGRGCLNYCVVLNKDQHKQLKDIGKSYEFILERMVQALSQLGINAEYLPISDIALVGSQMKISGNAQKRLRKYILHHGTVLYDFDLSVIEKYLKMPKDIPEYRQGRSHLDFVSNINIELCSLKDEIKKVFKVLQQEDLTNIEKSRLKELVVLKNNKVNLDG